MRFFQEFMRHSLSVVSSSWAGIIEMYCAIRTLFSERLARIPCGSELLKMSRSPASRGTLTISCFQVCDIRLEAVAVLWLGKFPGIVIAVQPWDALKAAHMFIGLVS